jgi:hypothetical protein
VVLSCFCERHKAGLDLRVDVLVEGIEKGRERAPKQHDHLQIVATRSMHGGHHGEVTRSAKGRCLRVPPLVGRSAFEALVASSMRPTKRYPVLNAPPTGTARLLFSMPS